MKGIVLSLVGIFWGQKEPKNMIDGYLLFNKKEISESSELSELLSLNQKKIIEKLIQTGEKDWVADQEELVELLKLEPTFNVRYARTNELVPLRNAFFNYVKQIPELSDERQLFRTIKEFAIANVTHQLKKRVDQRDIFIAQSIKSIDDINTILNTIYARISEWYSLHFPELVELARDNEQYIKMVAKLSTTPRSELPEEDIKLLGVKREELIIEAAKNSLGGDMDPQDLAPIKELASFGVEIIKTKERLEKYIDECMTDVAPNVQCLVGSLLGARLISLSGSLLNLAKSPASTIQVLGAEKALFRHIKTGEDPPKHGVIFQSAYIHSSKKHQRGKIARLLASKLAIAARVDYFTGEFIGDNLKAEVEKKIEKIRKESPTPSIRQMEQRKKQKKRKQKGKYKKNFDKDRKRRKRRKNKKNKGSKKE